MTMPVAAAAAPVPSYFRLLVITTRPGVTACSTFFRVPLGSVTAPLPELPVPPPPLKLGKPPLPEPPTPLPELADGWLPVLSAKATARPPAVAATAATAR